MQPNEAKRENLNSYSDARAIILKYLPVGINTSY